MVIVDYKKRVFTEDNIPPNVKPKYEISEKCKLIQVFWFTKDCRFISYLLQPNSDRIFDILTDIDIISIGDNIPSIKEAIQKLLGFDMVVENRIIATKVANRVVYWCQKL